MRGEFREEVIGEVMNEVRDEIMEDVREEEKKDRYCSMYREQCAYNKIY